jgi:hypothetical protein
VDEHDEVIRDAKAKLSALQKTIQYFQEMKKKGSPWPTEEGGFLVQQVEFMCRGGYMCKAINFTFRRLDAHRRFPYVVHVCHI